MLVRGDQFNVRTGRAVDDRHKVHLKTAVITAKGPWGQIILYVISGIHDAARASTAASAMRGIFFALHRNVELYAMQLMRLAVIKKHVFGRCGGVAETVADVPAKRNAVHQTGKLPEGEWEEFLRWLFTFEYGRLGLPEPDLVLWLDMPTERAVEMLRRREGETHTKGDIHEVDTAYLVRCRSVAAAAARLGGWKRISCVDGSGRVRPQEEIHDEIWDAVVPMLGSNTKNA